METKEETAMDNRPTYNWVDITQEFVEASSDLQLGELLHDSTFGLFEAMSAIEMMDSKMDAGMLCNQIQRKVLNFSDSTESGQLKIKELSIPELIGVMDATMACMVTWLEGHSLAQTVFTNLYLHNPYVIEDRCLKAFSLCTLKIVDHIRDRVNRAGVFEEEDFQTMTYGFKMAGDVTDVRVTGMMKELEEDLHRTLKTTRSKQGEERDAETEKEHFLTSTLFSRVKFHRLFYAMLLSFSKEKMEDFIMGRAVLTCEGIPQSQKIVVQLQELIPTIRDTLPVGVQPEQKELSKNDYPTIMGFEPLVNQRLLPPTFPRYTIIKSREAALEYMETLLNRLMVVTTVPQMTSLHTVLDTFKDFSKTSPCVLSRSILQLTLLPPNKRVFGVNSIVDFLKETIRGFIAPPALSPKSSLFNNPQAKTYVDAWFMQAVRPICTLIQTTGHNRARQRDKWGHLLEDLSALQEEADKVDAYLHQQLVKTEPNRQHLACLGNWVLYHTLQAMISYLLSGFELELYAPYEYHYIFWYLYEMLYSWLINTLHRADNFLLEHETIADNQQKGRNNKKNKKKKRTKTLNKEITMAQAEQHMFGGYYKAVLGLRLDGKLVYPSFEFDSEEVQYSHRFLPFTTVSTPPYIHYAQYKEMSDLKRYEPEASAQSLYTASCKCFHQAKALLESMSTANEEIQTLIKVAKTNFVVMKLLMGGHKKDSNEPPDFDFSQHKVYPVMKLM
ncbi:N-alpha-acetyltransferase 35, NatC auxiliary subunit-like isoform X1 [Mizuhopecten yessoensis]|uniref:N-alpha-acetyltransferase 35, NatC auxiliary subunit-like isoform X1 n=1 Tax=Mizuhopecten yessoensis TaxID=6573 RepID=UPI000B45E31A|nr:N-alpha-acetyltransferase 35, NatC auxiliary subunit-like isoform X1 [Mizuhopecten yessoensis]XP_021369662.1 N-alpha-acetyltransferase 35, NatC auxiliary subunit-like isoform X1 [Mizuhopecten yessoensis]